MHELIPHPETLLPHLAFKNALLKPFGDFEVLGGMSQPFSLLGPAVNLALLQTPTFRFVWPHWVRHTSLRYNKQGWGQGEGNEAPGTTHLRRCSLLGPATEHLANSAPHSPHLSPEAKAAAGRHLHVSRCEPKSPPGTELLRAPWLVLSLGSWSATLRRLMVNNPLLRPRKLLMKEIPTL